MLESGMGTSQRNAFLLVLLGCSAASAGVMSLGSGGSDPECEVANLARISDGMVVWSPYEDRYVVNKKDEAGIYQLYAGPNEDTGPVCITCTEEPNGPAVSRHKLQPHWHPSGRWIFVAVERDTYDPPPILGWSREYVEGQLQNGLWTNMWAVSPDGKQWRRMTDFASGESGRPDGYTGPALSNDGQHAVWSQIISGNVFVYWPFGKWELILADIEDDAGMPRFTNIRDITPEGMNWNEPGNFHPDGESLLLSGSREADAQGMDQYILNIRTNQLTNLTNSPTVWDEHGVFSPDGEKILFMSAYPYRDDPNASKVLSIKTEFMLMNNDGSNLVQLTHFREPGYPEHSAGIAASSQWTPDGMSIVALQLFFPTYRTWAITFAGACGKRVTY